MSRTFGSKNKNRRKDFGKKRKKYAGKKTKPRRKFNDSFRAYESKKKKDSNIKVAFWKVDVMSPKKYMNFSDESRRFMQKKVYGRGAGRIYLEVKPEMLSTKDNIAELCLEYLWQGEWLIMMCSHTKNKHHVSYKAFGRVVLKDYEKGMKCSVYPSYKRRSLRRYYFWKDE